VVAVDGAGDCDGCADGGSGGVGDLEAEVAGVALGVGEIGGKEQKQKEIDELNAPRLTDQVGHPLLYIGSRDDNSPA